MTDKRYNPLLAVSRRADRPNVLELTFQHAADQKTRIRAGQGYITHPATEAILGEDGFVVDVEATMRAIQEKREEHEASHEDTYLVDCPDVPLWMAEAMMTAFVEARNKVIEVNCDLAKVARRNGSLREESDALQRDNMTLVKQRASAQREALKLRYGIEQYLAGHWTVSDLRALIGRNNND